MKFYVKRRKTPQIIIVSLIDIFAILLIFFIVTTTFKTAQSQLSINLPEAKTANQGTNNQEPLVLAITPDEKLYLGDKQLAGVDELASELKAHQEKSPNQPVAMSASKEVSFGFLVQVLDALKQAGIKNLPAFTQPKDSK
ncbi:MAG: biopolymer transporter ExbD [Verrucomicrobia bacterium]|nr:biopolymer transporter ExbD [Verrucomicrobiota bacterium]